jgi:hypothetical protein
MKEMSYSLRECFDVVPTGIGAGDEVRAPVPASIGGKSFPITHVAPGCRHPATSALLCSFVANVWTRTAGLVPSQRIPI